MDRPGKLRLLILSQFYSPEPADQKIHTLARDLAARGHRVSAVTAFPNYPHGKIYSGYRQRWRQWEDKDGVRVLRLPLYSDHSRSAWKRSAHYLSFAASATLLGPALCGPADLMWAYQPPLTVGIPACWISLLRRMPFVYEIQDMWPETVAATGILRSRVALDMLARLARLVYRNASAITVQSPGFRDNLLLKQVAAEKIHVIPNWADEDIYRPVPADPALAEQSGLAGRFNVMFAGNLGAAQALHTVLRAAASVRSLPQVQFVFVGDGLDESALRRQAAEEKLDNVCFLGRQPAQRMPYLLALAQVALIHLKRDPLFEITIPGKTTAYLACGRPILCAVAGNASQMVQEAGAGLTCPPEDPEALAQVVRDFYSMLPETREAMGEAGRCAFLKNYTRNLLVDRYENLFYEVVEKKRSR